MKIYSKKNKEMLKTILKMVCLTWKPFCQELKINALSQGIGFLLWHVSDPRCGVWRVIFQWQSRPGRSRDGQRRVFLRHMDCSEVIWKACEVFADFLATLWLARRSICRLWPGQELDGSPREKLDRNDITMI